MVTLNRWLTAQEYEQSFWTKLANKIETGAIHQLDWYQWKASELAKRLAKHLTAGQKEHGRVLEIGSGPIGIINFLEYAHRYSIDPLEPFYKASATLSELRKPGTNYLGGTGENLPFPESFFSLVIIDNVIDHTYSPTKVLQEMNRVLENNGLLYLAVNIRTAWGAMMHKVLASLHIDKGHPHTFTNRVIRDLLSANQFKISKEEIDDYYDVNKQHLRSENVRERIKGYTGISEFAYRAFCHKYP